MTGAPLDSRITFSRTTNATLVDSTGLVTYAPNNLVLRSEEFDNAAWTKTRSSITANATTSPDGTANADRFVIDTTAATNHAVGQSASVTSGTTYALTVFAKADQFSQINLRFSAQFPAGNVYYDLNNGTISSAGSVVSASMTSFGNGWWRCVLVMTANATGAAAGQIFLAQSNSITIATADGTSGLFIWGAQLEQVTYQTLPSTYVQTVASAYYGPRFDYDPVTLAPRGLLIEEQRVNLLLYSAELDNAAWTKAGSTITANATTSPDGTTNADKLVENTVATTQHRVQQAATTVIGTSYSFSVYLKAGERTAARVRAIGTATFADCTVNLTAGTISVITGAATITNAGNGWYRVSVSGAADSTTTTCYVNLIDAGSITYTGDGVSGAFVWGAQLEAGTFATSYIPTVASTVTRAADVAVMTGTNFSSWYNASEGTMVAFYNTTTAAVSSALGAFGVSDTTSNERMQIRRNNVNTNAGFLVVDGGVTQYSQTVVAASGPYRSALAYANGDIRGVNNGTLATAGSGTIPTVTQAEIGFGQGIGYLNGHLSSVTYYATRLTNAQLQALSA
jgi:hypothetical protein